jgi:hypothetical protein
MNPHLEALLRAYDAYVEASDQERDQREAIYHSHLDDVAERTGVAREKLHLSVKFQHREWIKAQKKPASLPKKA